MARHYTFVVSNPSPVWVPAIAVVVMRYFRRTRWTDVPPPPPHTLTPQPMLSAVSRSIRICAPLRVPLLGAGDRHSDGCWCSSTATNGRGVLGSVCASCGFLWGRDVDGIWTALAIQHTCGAVADKADVRGSPGVAPRSPQPASPAPFVFQRRSGVHANRETSKVRRLVRCVNLSSPAVYHHRSTLRRGRKRAYCATSPVSTTRTNGPCT